MGPDVERVDGRCVEYPKKPKTRGKYVVRYRNNNGCLSRGLYLVDWTGKKWDTHKTVAVWQPVTI